MTETSKPQNMMMEFGCQTQFPLTKTEELLIECASFMKPGLVSLLAAL